MLANSMHPALVRITSFEIIGPTALRVAFSDHTSQDIEFADVLRGELYSPLASPEYFRLVKLDPEVGTIVWPNGADFDPSTLRYWPDVKSAMIERAKKL